MGLLDLARSLFAPANSQAITAPAPTTRADSWSNLVTGIGAATGRLDFQFTRELRIDDQTLEDDTITIRDRDSLAQERISIARAREHLLDRLSAPWVSPKTDS